MVGIFSSENSGIELIPPENKAGSGLIHGYEASASLNVVSPFYPSIDQALLSPPKHEIISETAVLGRLPNPAFLV
jgi:hypothetical protein